MNTFKNNITYTNTQSAWFFYILSYLNNKSKKQRLFMITTDYHKKDDKKD